MTIPIPTPSKSGPSPSSRTEGGARGEKEGEIKLYPHRGSTLLPLLEAHRPRSLPVLTTIQENISKSRSESFDSEIRVDWDLEEVWATFPVGSIPHEGQAPGGREKVEGRGERLWGVVVRMQEAQQVHLRYYCSAERVILVDPSSSSGSKTNPGPESSISISIPNRHAVIGDEDEGEARSYTNKVAKAIVGVYGRKVVLGAIDSRWNEMREEFRSGELAECMVFLAPGSGSGSGSGWRSGISEGEEGEDGMLRVWKQRSK